MLLSQLVSKIINLFLTEKKIKSIIFLKILYVCIFEMRANSQKTSERVCFSFHSHTNPCMELKQLVSIKTFVDQSSSSSFFNS